MTERFLGAERYQPVLEHIWEGLGIVTKPWGSYSDLLRDKKYVVKSITINPGESLSLQRHADRNEFWLIISGYGRIQLGSLSRDMQAGQTVQIYKKEIHRATNTGNVPFVILELQYGDDCSEEDIERLEDQYGRRQTK